MSIEKAKELILAGKNVCILGSGGTGKSTLIHEINNSRTLLAAPTGAAALNIGGMTVHSLFGLPHGIPTQKDCETVSITLANLFKGKQPPTRILLDEASMLRADTLDLIDTKLQLIKGNTLPFGGIQVVLFGDFYQIEPIVTQEESGVFHDYYDTPFCFSSNCWDFEVVQFKKVWRQEDKRQVAMLNSIRKGDKNSDRALRLIQEEALPYGVLDNNILHICTYKKDTARINNYWYNKLGGREHTYEATIEGKASEFKQTPVDASLKLKVGCRVIICANGKGYVNGSTGVLVDTTYPVKVELDKGGIVEVEEHEWESFKYAKAVVGIKKKTTAKFTQIPLMLGYATTIHKVQGATLDDVALDVGKGCFGHGMLYVALSRLRDLKRLRVVRKITKRNIVIRKEVQEFYESLEE